LIHCFGSSQFAQFGPLDSLFFFFFWAPLSVCCLFVSQKEEEEEEGEAKKGDSPLSCRLVVA